MDEDDLPPQPAADRDGGFSGALGRTIGNFVWIALAFAIIGGVLYLVTRWH